MTKLRPFLFVALAALASTTPAFGQRETVDKIAVVVGNEIILASEVASSMQRLVLQTGERPKSEEDAQKLRDQVLNQLIADKLFLAEAKKDTTISVRPEEVQQAVKEQMARVRENFTTDAEFASELQKAGMTQRDLERQYSDELEKQLLKQRYIQKKLMTVSISRHEVEQFYQQFKDSIPNLPERVQLAHILLPVAASSKVEDSVKALAAGLRQQILDGADFATLSSRYSSAGAGENGGDLGYIAREDIAPDFARAAFNLNVGEISGVVRTQFGYHIIKNENRREDKLKLRHILLAVTPGADDTARTVRLGDSLMTLINSGSDFAELAKAFSSDDETRPRGGQLGWYAADKLPDDIAATVKDWKTVGEIRGPVVTKFGVQIVKLLDYQEQKQFSIDSDYDRIKEMARQDKTARMVDKWVEEIKSHSYIDYRLEG